MIRSLIARGAAALAFLSLVASPALADITVKDGTGASVSVRGVTCGSATCYGMANFDASGTWINPATKEQQAAILTATQALLQPGGIVNLGASGVGGSSGNPLYVAASPRFTDAITIAQAPAVTASSAYASGNVVGTLLTFAGAGRNASGNGTLQDVVVQFKSQQTAAFDLVLLSANPSSTTITDKTALSLAAADVAKVVAVIHTGSQSCNSLGTTSTCEAHNQGLKFTADASTNLYGILVVRGTPTFNSTSDVNVQIGAERNY